MCTGLPTMPDVLDLGCGVGGQTFHLAELTGGLIAALDRHVPSIERLRGLIAALGLEGRIRAVAGDMAEPGLPPASFDLIWSEGALYNIGIERALRVCHGLLRPGGYLAFTDAVWRTGDPPVDLRAGFEADYPAMGRVQDIVATIERSGLFSLTGHFPLPDEAWWDDYYTPMEARIVEMREKYANDGEALAVLDELAREPAMHRVYGEYYGYEFFVARAR